MRARSSSRGGRFLRRHCERSEAIHFSARSSMDRFVAEFIVGPAKGRIRWLLVMTVGAANIAGSIIVLPALAQFLIEPFAQRCEKAARLHELLGANSLRQGVRPWRL